VLTIGLHLPQINIKMNERCDIIRDAFGTIASNLVSGGRTVSSRGVTQTLPSPK
jgi:hypothetical protein